VGLQTIDGGKPFFGTAWMRAIAKKQSLTVSFDCDVLISQGERCFLDAVSGVGDVLGFFFIVKDHATGAALHD
jgi:hypothetical protein